jgi:hypothetical protein
VQRRRIGSAEPLTVVLVCVKLHHLTLLGKEVDKVLEVALRLRWWSARELRALQLQLG